MDAAVLRANWNDVRRRVDEACVAAGRDPAEVDILPVSKTFDSTTIRAAVAAGLHRFGENRVQEIRDKHARLVGASIDWVVIGHVQTNKAKDVARLASEVQSLDRLELAQALHRRLMTEERTLDVLIQVKTSPEESKHGLDPASLSMFLEQLKEFPCLKVNGLMTVAVNSDEPARVRACFRQLHELRDEMGALGHCLPKLSMGMSGDFPLAIAEGATELRIGSAIFGRRVITTSNHLVQNSLSR